MKPVTETIKVRGFHCTGCADNLGRALRTLEGVVRAEADYSAGHVEVRFDPERVSDDDIRDRIRATGFEPGDGS